ncbi:lysylphosphatidylglycerol synthase transmembrane domain-containing protein [Lyngbya confervoides]|uniref:Flippase-like domain-containing protein n=1 Tax=Lyngbya confervoides BDU141951 TaxID=1574623 RepID=A0ABD4T1T0_9CYAN|nr:lysylphosphatidylglycerol synthase transmembrane domain-containing protein [Lyngbya confervoides]MCM1982393.1 flippase-like domain-containing protein [Lyngbya confervoides BDU141951]
MGLPPEMRRRLSLAIALGISVALLIWTWHDVQWHQVGQILQGLQPSWVGLAWGLFILAFYLRANRWGLLLSVRQVRAPLGLRQAAVFIGFGSNCLFPFNAGELIRAKVLQTFAQVPLGLALGTLVSARLLDAATAFAYLILGLHTLAQPTRDLGQPLGILGAILIGLGVFLYGAAVLQRRILQQVSHALSALKIPPEPMITGLAGLIQGLEIFKSPRLLLLALMQSFGIWGLIGLSFWAMLGAFQLPQPGLGGAYFILGIQAIAAIIPASPGHLGTFEAAMRFALDQCQVPTEAAIAYTLVMRLMMYGTLIGLGLIYAMKLGLSTTLISETVQADKGMSS